MTEINLPVLELRDYQQYIWDRLWRENIKKAFLVWHRRGGKDLFCYQYLIAKAIKEIGNYWYLLPETQQVRNAIWEGVTAKGFKYINFVPPELIHKVDNQSMKIYLKDPNNPRESGSIISFLGGDRYDKRVGAGLKGCVISEYALQKVNLYDLAIEPMLKETDGWVLFNTTPRGENHAKDMFDFLSTKSHYLTSLLTIEDTKAVDPKLLDEERERGKAEELIQQEYYCSFEGAISGSYFGRVLKDNKDKFTSVPHDPRFKVHTFWDLGVSDAMAIWFIQFVGKAIHVIDHYENTDYGLAHYAGYVEEKPYQYNTHHLPHDGRKRELGKEEKALTIQRQLRDLGLHNTKVHPRRNNIIGTIQLTRALLPRCYFDKEKTKYGYECLKQYRREFDEKRNCFKETPLHDWSSHSFDAFSLITFVNEEKKKVGANRRCYS